MIELARPAGTNPLPRFREYVSVEFCRELERENVALRNRAEKAEDLAAYWQVQAEHLAVEIRKLQYRAEKAEDLAVYWQQRAEHLKRIVHAVELLDCSAISIENSGSEGLPWEISVCAIVEGDPQRWQNRRQYFGSTLLQALESLARKEAQP